MVGGLVAELRELVAGSRDRARILKRVLYAQLDVWYAVVQADPAEFSAIVPKVIAKVFRLDESEVRAAFGSNPVFERMAAALTEATIPRDLASRYQVAVD